MDSDEIVVAMSSPSRPHDSPADDSSPDDIRSKAAINGTSATTAPTKPTAPPKKTPTPLPPPPKRSRPTAKDLCRPAPGIESPQEVKDDLSGMGFTAKRVREIGGRKEIRLADGHLPKSGLEQAAGIGQGRGKREGKGKPKDYEYLRLGRAHSGSNETLLGDLAEMLTVADWVLFDPLRGYSDFVDKEKNPLKHCEPPPIYQQYEMYKPGNKRILEYHTRFRSVRLRTTPMMLVEGKKDVEYTSTGPKLVNVQKHDGLGPRGKRRVREEVEAKVQEGLEDSDLSDLDEGLGERYM